jgi:hypothetical protein
VGCVKSVYPRSPKALHQRWVALEDFSEAV